MRETDIPPFAPGDVVMLKSGGPAMPCASTSGASSSNIECVWFGLGDQPQRTIFAADLLCFAADLVPPARRRPTTTPTRP